MRTVFLRLLLRRPHDLAVFFFARGLRIAAEQHHLARQLLIVRLAQRTRFRPRSFHDGLSLRVRILNLRQ